jgi:hypothetical protein
LKDGVLAGAILPYPNWRAEYENVYRSLANLPIEQWSTDPYPIRDYCEAWHIRRDDFDDWYGSSPPSRSGLMAVVHWRAIICRDSRRREEDVHAAGRSQHRCSGYPA